MWFFQNLESQLTKLHSIWRYYEKAANVNKNLPLAPSYLYSAALAYHDAGDLDQARKVADQIIRNYDKSDYKQKAELLLEMIKLKT